MEEKTIFLDYEELEKETFDYLDSKKNIVLATCIDNEPTARTVSYIILDRVMKFFEKYFGINNSGTDSDSIEYKVSEDDNIYRQMVAEDGAECKTQPNEKL